MLIRANGVSVGRLGLVLVVCVVVREGEPESHWQNLQGSFPGAEFTALIALSLCEYQGRALTHCLSSAPCLSPSFHVVPFSLAVSKNLGVFTS